MRSVLSEAQVSKTGTSNYIPQYLRDVITCAWPCYLRFWHNTPDIEEPYLTLFYMFSLGVYLIVLISELHFTILISSMGLGHKPMI